MDKLIKIGTRGSKLALWQAQWVKNALLEKFPQLSIEIEIIKTTGDKILDVPLAKVGGKGLFVKEIEESLLSCRIDLAVHSMKDMPAEIPDGLCIAAVPEREDPRDALISRDKFNLNDLPQNSRLGTSSLRRLAQIRYLRKDLEIVSLRGNIDTRLKKLNSDNLDAIVLAAAGIKRLNFSDKVTQYLNEYEMLPAVGQGALCIEARKNDIDILSIVSSIDHKESHIAISGERAFLKFLEGGCQVPIAGFGKVENKSFLLTGLVMDTDGIFFVKDSISGQYDLCEEIGIELAKRLLSKGAKKILEA